MDELYCQRERKSQYVIWDCETTAVNQQTVRGQLVPYLIVAATVCYKCLDKKFEKHIYSQRNKKSNRMAAQECQKR